MNFYQDVFFKALDMLRGRKTIERLKFLRQSQYWTKEQLETWQLARLNELLSTAKQHSGYFSEQLKDLVLPLTSIDELSKIKVLTKDDIRKNFESIKTNHLDESRYVLSRTGGSTGVPMQYYWDKRGMDWNRGSVYRSCEWSDVALGEKTMHFSGSHFDESEAEKLMNKVVYFLQRYKVLSVGSLTEERSEQYVNLLCQYKPTSIWGYSSGVTAIAKHILSSSVERDFGFLKAIITSSETLTPEQRALINEAFQGDKVADHYGSREMYIASECKEHDGYHIHSEVLIVEILDPQGNPCKPSQAGRVVLTDLSNHAFPFIRYEIGDMAKLYGDDTCACGLTLPKISSVEGRIADVVVLKDRVLTPPNFTLIMSDKPGVKLYQIKQDTMDALQVSVVPDEQFNDQVKQYILTSLQHEAGPEVDIQLSIVDEIEVPESGKRRYVISNVAKDYL